MRAKLFTPQTLLWLALVLALAGSLKHLAAIFASVDGNTLMGWVQAVAIDAGLFALAYSIKVRKAAKRSTRPLWFGVVLFSAISIYGNLAYGLLATGVLPAWIVAIKPYILAGSLPILVLFLSELLSDDRQHAEAEAAKEAAKVARQAAKVDPPAATVTTELPPVAAQLPAVAGNGGNPAAELPPVATKAANIERLADLLANNPAATNTELAALLDVSRSTVRNYRQELATHSSNGRNQQ